MSLPQCQMAPFNLTLFPVCRDVISVYLTSERVRTCVFAKHNIEKTKTASVFMYECKALVCIFLAAHIFTISRGGNRAKESDAIRHSTNSDDIINTNSTTYALGPVKKKEDTRGKAPCGSLCVNISIKLQHVFPKRNHNEKTKRSYKQPKVSIQTYFRTFSTRSTHMTKTGKRGQSHKPEVQNRQNSGKHVNTTNHFGDTRNSSRAISRERRYAYEDNDEWQYDEKFDYDDDSEETKKWKKYAKNWDKIGLRLIYIGSTIIMITCCCFLCCRKCCLLVCSTCSHIVMTCVDRCRCRDPMYRKIKILSDRLGIQLDYDTYKAMKQGYTQDIAEQGFGISL
ncbi:uncharacterized protein LOC117315273 [Pecten maximus]|uniref:uncharacterized protein LOC117315273 n=1 Tax=Pecten maximus TaxID=6579 RepID=UPI001458A02A|nr:uncharacterized protein LOC117315273 [Pecten maximus]